MNLFISLILWAILLVLCWPLALLFLLLYPILWLLILPFKILGFAVDISLSFIGNLLMLPFTLMKK
ncbi:hypothetical protein [Echinicola sediminis]